MTQRALSPVEWKKVSIFPGFPYERPKGHAPSQSANAIEVPFRLSNASRIDALVERYEEYPDVKLMFDITDPEKVARYLTQNAGVAYVLRDARDQIRQIFGDVPQRLELRCDDGPIDQLWVYIVLPASEGSGLSKLAQFDDVWLPRHRDAVSHLVSFNLDYA